ncbi:TonB-dependent receptor domain-containing protein [Rhizosphaericola mali]|nr:TonB-dependent receptor [Rhizosphaericola mali]
MIKSDSLHYKNTLSDSFGNYFFNKLLPGKYELDFSFINYQSIKIPLILTPDTDTSINVSLLQKQEQLKDVNITSHSAIISRKIDRIIFNVNNNVNTIGLTSLELLSMTPEVKVVDNSISIIGKGRAMVMINDRLLKMASPEQLAAYLTSIPANAVEKIEVITNPPSMYSADGSTGLINIILKKKKTLGYSGSVNLTLTSPPSQTGASDISFNYNKDKIRYYAILSGSKGFHNPRYTNTIYYSEMTQKTSIKEKEESQYLSGVLGFEADLSKNSTLGASFNEFNSYPYQTNNIRTLFINSKTNSTDSISEQENKDKVTYNERSANIHYENSFDTTSKNKLVVDGDWFSNGFNFPNNIKAMMFDKNGNMISNRTSNTLSINKLSSDIYSLNGTFYIVGKNSEIYFGGKANFINSENYVSLNINNTNSDTKTISTFNKFLFTENTQALFGNYQAKFGEKWEFQSGLRSEYTQTKGIPNNYNSYDSIHKNSYFNFFPTIYFSYNISDKNTIAINYGRRIDRPNFNNFNPYLQYQSQYNYSEGNPYLRPSISNNFELTESYKNFNFTLQYSFSNKQVGRIGVIDTITNITISQLSNFLSSKNLVFGSNYTLNQIKWLHSYNEFDVYYNRSNSTSKNTAPVIDGWGAVFRSNNSIYFNKKKTLIGGIYFNYQFPEINGINKFKQYYYFNISGKYVLIDNKLVLGINVSDIFKTLNIPFNSRVNNILTTNMVNNDSRRLRITAIYSFGNSKMKKGQAHSQDSNNNRALNGN